MKRRVQCAILLGATGVALCAAFFLWPLIHVRPGLSTFAREKMVAQSNLKQIALALQTYRERYERRPTNLDELIPECISRKLPNPWAAVEARRAAPDWGYGFLVGRDVQYEGRHILLIASDGRHGGWILAESDGFFWVSDQRHLDAILGRRYLTSRQATNEITR